MLRLRPGVFTQEEQVGYEKVKDDITKTAWLAVGAFVSTSYFRYWQLKSNNKSVSLGISAIIASYTPAMLYYKV